MLYYSNYIIVKEEGKSKSLSIYIYIHLSSIELYNLMGKTRYQAIIKMMNLIPQDEIHLDKLKGFIRIHIGTTEGVVIDVLRSMTLLGFIKEDSEKPFIYKLVKNNSKL